MSADCCHFSYILEALCGEVSATGTGNVDDLVNGSDRAWTFNSDGNATLIFNEATVIDSLFLAGVSIAPGSNISIEINGQPFEKIDVGECSGCSGLNFYRRFDPILASDIFLDFGDPDGGDISVCAFSAGESICVEVADNWTIGVIEPSANPRRSLAGTRKVSCSPKWREISLRVQSLSDQNKQALLDMELCKGLALKLMLVIEDDGDPCSQNTFLASPKNLSKFTRQARFGRFSKPLILEEILCC